VIFLNKDNKYEEIINFQQNLDRKTFLNQAEKRCAGVDSPLPIGFGQTISQPSLVANMTYWLEPDPALTVLEIGTGSGYQTAFLAEFFARVYTVERIPNLSKKAQTTLDYLGYDNIEFKTGDGTQGWPENAPYDRIIVTAAASSVPEPLKSQLKVSGLLLIPVGGTNYQKLTKIKKTDTENFESEVLEYVRFVELVGDNGWQ